MSSCDTLPTATEAARRHICDLVTLLDELHDHLDRHGDQQQHLVATASRNLCRIEVTLTIPFARRPPACPTRSWRKETVKIRNRRK